MTRDDRRELAKTVEAHARTLAIAEACAATTRDLAAEVQRGGLPPRENLQQTVAEAERILAELAEVRKELMRLLDLLSS